MCKKKIAKIFDDHVGVIIRLQKPVVVFLKIYNRFKANQVVIVDVLESPSRFLPKELSAFTDIQIDCRQ